jgi:predicted secreted protein
MRFTSALSIFFLFWVAAGFILLPFGVRTHEEDGASRVPGQADSAPHTFDLPRHVVRATVLAVVLFGLYYANYVNGWITAEMLDFYN